MSEILWQPGKDSVQCSRMTDFTTFLEKKTAKAFPDYHSLHKWSIDNIEAFWETYLEYSGILFSVPFNELLNTHKMPGAKWFSGLRLNYAENLLAPELTGTAITFVAERHPGEPANFISEISYEDLRVEVARCARGLKSAGIETGDRVAGYVANVPEAVIACLACASIGATWSSASPDFGLNALVDRFSQVQPKLVFASTHYRYGGKIFRTDDVLKKLHENLPSLKKIVSIPYPVGDANIVGDTAWQDFIAPADDPPLEFAQAPFDHPLFILFSSGTTGPPKCLVHATGGILLQHKKELQLHSNLGNEDSLLFFTTCGWMMWNWQLSALCLGTNICLYDGSPGYPDLTAIWKLVDELKISHFGTSGRFIESCMKAQPQIKPRSLGKLSVLKTVLYTGSPLSRSGFHWIYATVKENLHLAGISGGTDIVSCFVLGNPNLPVHAGEIQCKGLGVDAVALNEAGDEVTEGSGELVCREPLPSMPIGFLNDPDGGKYHRAYFDVYPGLWRHGDYVEFTSTGGVIIHGRSDATLNPGGVRIGSSEIYSALDQLAVISGSVVVGWQPPGHSDEMIVLFVVLGNSQILDHETEKRIKQTIREMCSPRHVPQKIFQISEVPITRSGKTVELSVKAILAGKAVSNRNALANPEVLVEIVAIRESLLKTS